MICGDCFIHNLILPAAGLSVNFIFSGFHFITPLPPPLHLPLGQGEKREGGVLKSGGYYWIPCPSGRRAALKAGMTKDAEIGSGSGKIKILALRQVSSLIFLVPSKFLFSTPPPPPPLDRRGGILGILWIKVITWAKILIFYHLTRFYI